MIPMTRNGKRKRELRNLVKRGTTWYFKTMVDGRVKQVSLNTEDLEVAKAKRNQMEADATAGQLDKVVGPRTRAGTLEDVFKKYDAVGGLPLRTMGAVKSSLMTLVKCATQDETLTPSDVRLDQLTTKLVRDYQDKLRARYEAEAGTDEKARRIARDRADRTSKSTFNQAKSLFCKRRQLIERYQEAGILVPDCVHAFATAGTVGKFSSKLYYPPSDAIMAATFAGLDDLKKVDATAWYIFWAALATGGRRNELADMRVEHLVERDGRLWVSGGLGKDGETIEIPVIDWQVHAGSPLTPEQVMRELIGERKTGFLFDGTKTERYDEAPDRLNAWLGRLGWNDEKKLHGIRAFIACKIYLDNPILAQLYLRHKSIATTQKYYSHFLKLLGAFAFNRKPATPPTLTIVQTPGQEAA